MKPSHLSLERRYKMHPLLYILIAFVFAIGFILILLKYFELKQRKTLIKKLNKIGKLQKSSSPSYDYLLMIDNRTIKVRFIYMGSKRSISFNSIAHWQLHPSNKPKMINPKNFHLEKGLKLIIVYPTPTKMVKYINENEIVFVKPDELCFDYYVITSNELETIKEIV